jgi:c-di-GMP-binding flagellar brake protein YcgR
MGEEENRVHARIHVSTKIDVAGQDGMVECELKDVSKGGARFFSPSKVGEIGETVELFLPSLDGSDIAVMAQIIRNELVGGDAGEGGRMVAVRFDAVEPAMQRALSDLIELLLSSTGSGTRKHPRVARRIEIRFGQLGELRGILEDISRGGLLMTIPEPLSLYEEIDVIVPDLAGHELLTLHARVAHQRKIARESGAAFQVGLEFADLRPEARGCVDAVLHAVLEIVAPVEELEDAPPDEKEAAASQEKEAAASQEKEAAAPGEKEGAAPETKQPGTA